MASVILDRQPGDPDGRKNQVFGVRRRAIAFRRKVRRGEGALRCAAMMRASASVGHTMGSLSLSPNTLKVSPSFQIDVPLVASMRCIARVPFALRLGHPLVPGGLKQ